MKLPKMFISLIIIASLLPLSGCGTASEDYFQPKSTNETASTGAETEPQNVLPTETATVTPTVSEEASVVTPPPVKEPWQDDYQGLEIYDDQGNEVVRCAGSNEAKGELNYLLQAMVARVNADLQAKLHIGSAEAEDIIYNRQTRIFSTLNQSMQGIMDKVITDTSYYPGDLAPGLQAAMVVMDYHTGQVKALSGSRDTDYTEVNRATDVLRQPGSTFQILAAYAPAIDTGVINADSVVVDEPFTYNGFQPQNWWGDTYKGEMSVRDAVTQSANVVAVKVGVEAGLDNCFSYLKKFGFTTLVDNENINGTTFSDKTAAMALGGLTKGVNLLEQTAAYSAIANDGVYITPSFYTKVCDSEGKELLSEEPLSHQVLKQVTATSLTDIMSSAVSSPIGTGRKAAFKDLEIPVAGKTGSTADNKDLSFIGYTPYYAAGIWSGYDEQYAVELGGNSVMPIITVNQGYTLDIWRDVMEGILKEQNLPVKSFPAVEAPLPIKTPAVTETPTPTPALSYLDAATAFLKVIPHIFEQSDDIIMGIYKVSAYPITNEQAAVFDFESWIPVNEPDQVTRYTPVGNLINTGTLHYLGTRDGTNGILFTADCLTAWTETISPNHGYPEFMEYQIPPATAKNIETLCDTVMVSTPVPEG